MKRIWAVASLDVRDPGYRRTLLWSVAVVVLCAVLFLISNRTAFLRLTLRFAVVSLESVIPLITLLAIFRGAATGRRRNETAALAIRPLGRPAIFLGRYLAGAGALAAVVAAFTFTGLLVPRLLDTGVTWQSSDPLSLLLFGSAVWIDALVAAAAAACLTLWLGEAVAGSIVFAGLSLTTPSYQAAVLAEYGTGAAAPALLRFLPHRTVLTITAGLPEGAATALGNPAPQLALALAWVAVFLAVAVWRFEREDW